MTIGGTEVRFVVLIDQAGKILAGISDQTFVTAAGLTLVTEQKRGDLRFVEYEDGSVQAIQVQEGVSVPKGALYSDELIQKYLDQQTKDTETTDNKQDDIIIVDSTHTRTKAKEDIIVEDVNQETEDNTVTEIAND